MADTSLFLKILIELDALLDTRLAAIAHISEDLADKVINSGYMKYERLSDEMELYYEGVDGDLYSSIYKQRGELGLCKKAFVTNMLFKLDGIVRDHELKALAGNPETGNVEIDLNIYPYKLTQEEATELSSLVERDVGIVAKVNIVNIPYNKINFAFINQCKYTMLVFYNFNQWLYESLDGVKDRPIGTPSVIVVAPALFPNRSILEDRKNFKTADGKFIDPFDALTFKLADLFSLRFVDVGDFCLLKDIGEFDGSV